MHPQVLFAATPSPADAAGEPARDLAWLLCQHAAQLRRLAHRLLGWRATGHELDDVVQDVLLKAWQHRASFRGEASLLTWLSRITLHTAHDHHRRAQRWRRLFGWLLADAEGPAAEPGPEPEPLDACQRAMQRLAHGDREVLVLRYLEQRDIEEMAQLLLVSRAAIDARLSRARQRLRAELGLEAQP